MLPACVFRQFLLVAVAIPVFLTPLSPLFGQTIDADTVIRVIEGAQGKGSGDLDGDGRTTHVDIFLLSLGWRDSVTRLSMTSPIKNESDVAITRETILQFSGPLDPDTVNSQSIFATFAGNILNTHLNLSPDRTKATLFFDNPLPPSARVRVTVDGNRIRDNREFLVDVDRDGFLGGIEHIDFNTLTLTTIPGTVVCGRVFATELETVPGATDSVNVPLEGVTLSVDGMENDLFAITDSLGNFRLDPAPAGKFFVHIDGRTVTQALIEGATVSTSYPEGYYYPFVGKAWESYPGQEVNIGNIYLPLVTPGTLVPVSDSTDTTIPFPAAVLADHPEFAGAQVVVPMDSLYADDGTRGGMVGIAPVPPDRMPGTLPEFMMPPILITVQTDGATNFDTPVSLCLPNLPDPQTGVPAAPGSKRALFSFNHDIGDFENVGLMTVSEDGTKVCTDDGVGVVAPGWHFPGPPPDDPPDPCDPPGGKKSNSSKGLGGGVIQSDEDFFEWYRRDAKIGHELLMARLLNRAVFKDGPKLGGWFIIPEAAGGILLKIFACNNEIKPPPKQGGKSLSSGGRSVASKGLLDDPMLDQIDEIFLEMVKVLYPYEIERLATGSQEPLPAEVIDQAYDFLDQANALVGGDVQSFLESKKVEFELALKNSTYYNNGGMAVAEPPHPIYFAACILRDTSNLVLRRKTLPQAQYEVFIPSDGRLLQVLFYDPVKKALGAIVPNESPNRDHALPRSARFTQAELTNPGVYEHEDTDVDGLPDIVEFVLGTETDNTDSDNDGTPDGAELDQGTDPLDGRPVATGIIATANTPGNAVDVATSNNLVAIADSNAGISVFNVFNGMNPTIIAQVDTPGSAERVALSGLKAAVADGQAGLAILDLSDPPAAEIEVQLNLRGAVQAVAIAGDVAYAGLSNGDLVWVDIQSREEVGRVRLPQPIEDLGLLGDYLYALTGSHLHTLNRFAESSPPVASVVSPFISSPNERLFVGADLAYTVHGMGYNTFSLNNPEVPMLVGLGNAPQFGWRHIVDNGAGLGFAAVNLNFAFDGPNDVSLYDVSSPTSTNVFVEQFATPGMARAVSIYNGLGYVADGASGMQVVNYVSFDNQRVPPVLLEFHSPLEVEEGSTYRLVARATDDVQVRNVEFHVDGSIVITDGNFPFEAFLPAPLLSEKASFIVQCRVSDTGGSFVFSETRTVSVVEDKTPPRVRSISPARGATVGTVQHVRARFSEPLDPMTVTPSALQLFEIGADLQPGTGDDILISGGSLSQSPDLFSVTLTYSAPLDAGSYLVSIPSEVTDLAGNILAPPFTSTFRSFDFTDTDQDGMPDELEAGLGLVVGNPDTDGDGILDGDEDFDADGLSNSYEILITLTDPKLPDSDGNLVNDGAEDFDHDSLVNTQEFTFATSPFLPDTDGDGWNDETEVTAGANPLSPASTPSIQKGANPLVQISIPSSEGILSGVVIAANPSVAISLLSSISELFTGVIPGYPSVQISIPSSSGDEYSPTIVAKPPVDIEIAGQP